MIIYMIKMTSIRYAKVPPKEHPDHADFFGPFFAYDHIYGHIYIMYGHMYDNIYDHIYDQDDVYTVCQSAPKEHPE